VVGRSLAAYWRMFASGTIFTTLPVGMATKPCHLQDGQERLVELVRVIGVEDSIVTWARTRGSMMKFYPLPCRPLQ